jgi:hypothetical protein
MLSSKFTKLIILVLLVIILSGLILLFYTILLGDSVNEYYVA